MIHVVASVRVKPGKREEFVTIFKANVPAVRAEAGCIAYAPTVDAATDIPVQEKDGNAVTVIERWASLAALLEHLAAPHMLAYREKTKDLVEGIRIQVLEEA